MRHNSRRSKSNNNNSNSNSNRGRKGGQPRTQVFDSNGPDVRIRGTAHQVFEKYEALSKDAFSSGDMIMGENYRQHAEHYQRMINAFAETAANNVSKQKERVAVDGNSNKQQSQTPAAASTPAPTPASAATPAPAEDLGLPASMVREAKTDTKTLADA